MSSRVSAYRRDIEIAVDALKFRGETLNAVRKAAELSGKTINQQTVQLMKETADAYLNLKAVLNDMPRTSAYPDNVRTLNTTADTASDRVISVSHK